MAFQRLDFIYFAPSEKGGRGVFTAEPIAEGSLIEICPMIVCNEGDLEYIHTTKLHDYYFLWGDEETNCAIALGYGSLYNHSAASNAKYLVDEVEDIMHIIAIKDINAGEEITVNYNGSPDIDDKVWFEKA